VLAPYSRDLDPFQPTMPRIPGKAGTTSWRRFRPLPVNGFHDQDPRACAPPASPRNGVALPA